MVKEVGMGKRREGGWLVGCLFMAGCIYILSGRAKGSRMKTYTLDLHQTNQ